MPLLLPYFTGHQDQQNIELRTIFETGYHDHNKKKIILLVHEIKSENWCSRKDIKVKRSRSS